MSNRLIIKNSQVSGRIPTGTTANEQNFIKQGEIAINLSDKKIFSYDGTDVFEFGVNSFLEKTGGTVNSLSASSLSANTIYSGSTNLYSIFAPFGLQSGSFNQNGTNTFTGGTSTLTSVNITSATFANLSTSGTNVATQFSATTISGGTLFSGSTNLYSIFSPIISVGATATTLSSWTSSGVTYFSDFNHGLNTRDYIVNIYDVSNFEDIIVDKLQRINLNTLRVFVSDNTLSIRVLLSSRGF